MQKILCSTCGAPADDTGMRVKGKPLYKCADGHVTKGTSVVAK